MCDNLNMLDNHEQDSADDAKNIKKSEKIAPRKKHYLRIKNMRPPMNTIWQGSSTRGTVNVAYLQCKSFYQLYKGY